MMDEAWIKIALDGIWMKYNPSAGIFERVQVTRDFLGEYSHHVVNTTDASRKKSATAGRSNRRIEWTMDMDKRLQALSTACTSYSDIARILRVSRTAVEMRIEKLRDLGEFDDVA